MSELSISATDNFYDLFELPLGFEIDTKALSERYRQLQRLTHPDRFASASEQEKRVAMQQASLVNEAYQTLKSPLARARYLLSLKGVEIDDADTSMDTGFLMQQMELRERLEAIPNAADPFDALTALRDDVERLERELTSQIEDAFEIADAEALERGKQAVRKLQFFERLLSELEEAEENLADQL